ncbi:MAG TPA: malto-oligosyltrehalose trehalohydrolase [Thermoanaerobaculia bacterium]|nr:malto-oligosyltrehalose trehalohydrolase [Thermoanaerobaculia bacterium]
MNSTRRRRVGAELVAGGVDFRVWAPARLRVSVVLDDGEFVLEREKSGHFSATIAAARAGTRYRFRLDDEKETYPDPASRYQPDGPHCPSQVIDPQSYRWRNTKWHGVSKKGLVVYEMHVGTFTPDGTFISAIDCLPHIAEIGINLIEVMPVHEFPGRFGWGYDGVDLWAPTRLYGTPDDFRSFVDAAHDLNLGVILDVVYNHFGPDGCYLSKFTPDYFTKKYPNDWGESINFDDENSEGVREFVAENAAYWIDEFHLDGLRLDATQSIVDLSDRHVLQDITERAHSAASGRDIILIAENEEQKVRLVDELGVDAMWNDDWHHSAYVATTGRIEAYYTDYRGNPQEFVSMAKFGFLYQGQRYKWQKKRRGTPSFHLSPEKLVCYLQNHDQVANSAFGERLHRLTAPGVFRAMTALLLLQPQTPMLFQGQEFGSSSPFLYFADHERELAEKVANGRREFLRQFPSIESVETQLARPDDVKTFQRSKLKSDERTHNRESIDLHRDLIALRREDRTISQQRSDILEGAVIGDAAFVLRWLTGGDDDRLLVVNLGRDLHLDPAPEPLLAPPIRSEWDILWSSESPRYGGSGIAPLESEENWKVPAHAAVLLGPRALEK